MCRVNPRRPPSRFPSVACSRSRRSCLVRAGVEDEFHKLRYEGVFTPPSVGGTGFFFPGNVGGANWGSGAYDAGRGLLFVAANRLATVVRI